MFRFTVPAVLTLAACGGGSYCERSAELASDCEGAEEISDEDVATCEEQLADCNGDDEELLEESLDCMEENDINFCDTTGGTETNMTEAMDDMMAALACFTPLVNLSEECQSGMGMTMTMTMTPESR